MKKYFYFRAESTLANDDGKGDSVLIPIENITGFQASGDTTLDVHYEPQEFADKKASSNTAIITSDKASLTITTAKRKVVMEALASATNNGPHEDGIITVADDVTGTYLHPDITACGITVNFDTGSL